MKQCPNCNAQIDETANVCIHCGCNIMQYEERNAASPRRKGNEVIFGLWPQSAKANSVTVNGSADKDGYYTGNDGERYAKVENKYFKIEPIV